MKVQCRLCERKLEDSFEAKWKHALKHHPEEMFSNVLAAAFNISDVREQGIAAGKRLRENVINQFRGGLR